MPYRKALEDFNKKNGYTIKDRYLADGVGNIVRNNGDKPAAANQSIRNRIQNYLGVETRNYEKYRQEMMLRSKAKPNDQKLKAKVEKMSDPHRFVEGCINLFDAIARTEAHRQRSGYNPLPYFGFKGSEFVDLAKEQVNGYTYREGRRFELFRAYGILDQRFINEAKALEDMAKRGVDYNNATGVDEENILKTYITKQLVEQRLKKHNWLWKVTHRGETKAMKAYLETANRCLNAVKFPPNTPDEAELFASQSYAMTDPAQKEDFLAQCDKWEKTVDDKVATAKAERQSQREAKRQEEERRQEEQRIAEFEKKARVERAKRAKLETTASKAAVEAANDKPIEDRWFETKFRPSFDPAEFQKQYESCKAMKSQLPAGIPREMKIVFSENTQKMVDMKNFLKKVSSMSDQDRQYEEDKLVNSFYEADEFIEHKVSKTVKGEIVFDYKPLTYKELCDNDNKVFQDQLGKDINKDLDAPKQEKAASNDQKVKEKEEIVKSDL